jgi:poly(3-hydroxybutyrate) depolymerase
MFGITSTRINGRLIQVHEEVAWQSAFCRLLHFKPDSSAAHVKPPLLLVAPMSGHYATPLRETVKAFLPHREVYITDWWNAPRGPAD